MFVYYLYYISHKYKVLLMSGNDIKYYVELFQLLFLDFLGRKLKKRECILKGGCNFRFFFRSIRYSENIDLDVKNVTVNKLEDIVASILDSQPFAQILAVHGLSIKKWSSPEQTETTQRWKLLLGAENISMPINTKIEFSRRESEETTAFESVDPLLIRKYSLTPFMCMHYTAEAAYRQKLEALITRAVTQARDIFDLHFLLSSGVKPSLKNFCYKNRLQEAVSNALTVTYEIFKSQVLSYLGSEYQSQYSDPEVWEGMVLKVVEALEEGKNELN